MCSLEVQLPAAIPAMPEPGLHPALGIGGLGAVRGHTAGPLEPAVAVGALEAVVFVHIAESL